MVLNASKRPFSNLLVNRRLVAVKAKYPLSTQKSICKLFSFYASICKESKAGFWANIHWKALKQVDPGYVATRKILINERLLDVNWNVSYGHKAKNPHTRSYRIAKDKFDTGFFWYSFSGTKNPKKRKDAPIKDTTTAEGIGIDWQKSIFEQLTVESQDFVSTGNAKTDSKILRAFKKVQAKAFNGCRGRNVGRLFNTITMMPKQGRPYLRLNGRPLSDSDWKTCHAFLILTICHPSEREFYCSLITHPDFDIYDSVATWAGIKWQDYIVPHNYETGRAKHICRSPEEFRDEMKKEFLRFLNGSKKIKNNCFSNYYKLNFPRTLDIIISGGKTNAKYFQDLESKFMDMLAEYCADNKFIYLQCHDGFLSTEADSKLIAKKLIDIVFSNVGYTPIIKSKVLCNKHNSNIKDKEDLISISSYTNGVGLEKSSNKINPSIKSANSNANGHRTFNNANLKKKRDFPPWLLDKIRRAREKKCATVGVLDVSDPVKIANNESAEWTIIA